MTYSDIPRAMRRTKRSRIDWQHFFDSAFWTAFIIGLLIAYGMACMVLGGWMTMQWQGPHVSYALPVHAAGTVKSLASVCARAAIEGALTGDLLDYCE